MGSGILNAKIIKRALAGLLKNSMKSVLLLGPRQVGKSTLILELNPDLSINLADELEFLKFSSSPNELSELIQLNNHKTVYIDEIQRLPRLMNTIQAIIDHKKNNIKFYLTGSSARKLKRGGANLLPGRVLNFQMGPLVSRELNYQMLTSDLLKYGSLPEIYLTKDEKLKKHLLRSYSANYLKEEIKAEALTRNLEAFARFLTESVLHIGKFIDLTKLSKNAKISRHTCPRYFEILEDTMIAYRVYPFPQLIEKMDLIRHPKFYFFDNGVYNGLVGNYEASADRVGVLAEQLVYNQLRHSASACLKDIEIYSYRPRSGDEVDFIINLDNKIYAVEVKNSDQIKTEEVQGLVQFKKDFPKVEGLFVFHMKEKEFHLGPVHILSWQKGLKKMGL